MCAILDYGIRFRNIHVVEKVFVVCCMLHNNMLSEMKTTDSDARVGRGGPIDGDGLWLRGDEREFAVEDNRLLATLWGQRRAQLAKHIKYCDKQAKKP